jgi:hypothetical protein
MISDAFWGMIVGDAYDRSWDAIEAANKAAAWAAFPGRPLPFFSLLATVEAAMHPCPVHRACGDRGACGCQTKPPPASTEVTLLKQGDRPGVPGSQTGL